MYGGLYMSEIQRGSQYGGKDYFNVEMGGLIRKTFPVLSTNTTDTWKFGSVMAITSAGYAELADQINTSGLYGLAYSRRTVVNGRPEEDHSQAADKVSVILDEAIVKTAQVVSGILYSPNDQLSPDGATGLLTNVDPGSMPVMGKVLAGGSVADGSTVQVTVMLHNHSIVS